MLALLSLLVAVQATTSSFAADKNRPVTKVINLIKDMQTQLQKEAEEDQEVYEKVACWCESNDKSKTVSIADAEGRITDLTSTIEELTASSARLNTEIKNLNSEIAKNQAALDKATAIRQKELAEFNGEEKDMLQSIGALKSAVTVLSKHHESFAQVPSEQLLDISAMINHQFIKYKDLLREILTPKQKKIAAAFVQAPGDYFDADPTFKQSYAPQSGAIFGILKQMKETFESNLSASQKEEMTNQQAYDDLKAAKETEIKAGTDQRDTKTQELADTDSKLANSKQDLEDTRNTLSADQKFLLNLKEICQQTDQEWESRTKARQEEIQACSQALAILSSDDAHDTFTKTFNFVQVSKESKLQHQDARTKAATLLAAAAKKFSNPRLSTLATKVRLDAFAKVIESLDQMKAELKKEKEDDIKMKDFCTEALHENEMAQSMKSRDIADLQAKIEQLASEIDELAKSIATLQAEVAELQLQLKRAGEDRELENKDFQTTVADQRETQRLLSSALKVLEGVYAKKFVQVGQKVGHKQPAGPPPPPGFKEYKQSSGAGGLLSMIQQIITDAKTLEADAIQAETDAQKAYESFVKDTNFALGEKSRDITTKSETKATAEGDKVAASEDLSAALNMQQQNEAENADLHKSCDFTMQNFDIRQASLEQEMESLEEAKAVLRGMSGSFIQTDRKFLKK
jgi:chromosome segregation ATPase